MNGADGREGRYRVWAPVDENAELCIDEPGWSFVLSEGFPGRFILSPIGGGNESGQRQGGGQNQREKHRKPPIGYRSRRSGPGQGPGLIKAAVLAGRCCKEYVKGRATCPRWPVSSLQR